MESLKLFLLAVTLLLITIEIICAYPISEDYFQIYFRNARPKLSHKLRNRFLVHRNIRASIRDGDEFNNFGSSQASLPPQPEVIAFQGNQQPLSSRSYNRRPTPLKVSNKLQINSPQDLWSKIGQLNIDGQNNEAFGYREEDDEFVESAQDIVNRKNEEDNLFQDFFSHVKSKSNEKKNGKDQYDDKYKATTTNEVNDEGTTSISFMTLASGIQARSCPSGEVLKDGKCRSKARFS